MTVCVGVLAVAAVLAACHRPTDAPAEPASTNASVAAAPSAGASEAATNGPASADAPAPTCAKRFAVWESGATKREVCEDDLEKEGLTVVDLSDDWAPHLFDEDASLGKRGTQPYRKTLIALQNEAFAKGPEFDRAKDDKYLELFGIEPTPNVVRKRLMDDERHQCHDAIDNVPLLAPKRTINPWKELALQQSDLVMSRRYRDSLEIERKKRGLETIDELEGDKKMGHLYEQYKEYSVPLRAIGKAQEHLSCDGLLKRKGPEGIVDYATGDALKAFQRKHMIVSWDLDEETRATLATDTRELDFRTLLRTLRERVVDATGLIEDGTAINEPGQVAGRQLDSVAFRAMSTAEPLDDGAPDLVAGATDAAARALGWTGPAAARAFFERLGPKGTKKMRVAIKLPPPPAYHTPDMDLHVVIDRGEVRYDYPYTMTGLLKFPPTDVRPMMILYAKIGDRDIPLVRWATTIGGWKPEKILRHLVQMVYKDSTPGLRVWRDLIVSPVWIPPENAPKRDLVRPRWDGNWTLSTDLFGPGYASAFGMVKLVHHRVVKSLDERLPSAFHDEGIGTHGSVSYDSIHHGTSHGCHRLFNHLSLRLGEYLLRHHAHEVKGRVALGYGRSFLWEGKTMRLGFEDGGFKYELTPPVPVEVLKGKLIGTSPGPLRPKNLPDTLAKRFAQDRLEN